MERSPVGFLSYAHIDDQYEEGYITQLRERLEKEIRLFTGEAFSIFHDRVDIRWGEAWAARISKTLSSVSFLFPVLTPSFFKSEHCLGELREFLDLEEKTRRGDLILPIYYIESLILENAERRRFQVLAETLSTRQFVDWRDLRGVSFRDPRARTRLTAMAKQVRDVLDKAAPPEGHFVSEKGLSVPPKEGSSVEAASSSLSFYEDFVLQISRKSDGAYVLRVLSSPAGEAEAQLPEGHVLQGIEEVTQITARMGRTPGPAEIKELGLRLYNMLLPPPIEDLFCSVPRPFRRKARAETFAESLVSQIRPWRRSGSYPGNTCICQMMAAFWDCPESACSSTIWTASSLKPAARSGRAAEALSRCPSPSDTSIFNLQLEIRNLQEALASGPTEVEVISNKNSRRSS